MVTGECGSRTNPDWSSTAFAALNLRLTYVLFGRSKVLSGPRFSSIGRTTISLRVNWPCHNIRLCHHTERSWLNCPFHDVRFHDMKSMDIEISFIPLFGQALRSSQSAEYYPLDPALARQRWGRILVRLRISISYTLIRSGWLFTSLSRST